MIRQFEIQKASMQSLLNEYLIDENDASDSESSGESEICTEKQLVSNS